MVWLRKNKETKPTNEETFAFKVGNPPFSILDLKRKKSPQNKIIFLNPSFPPFP